MEAYKTEDKPKIKYDGSIAIATGKSRKETHWKNKNILWSELVDKLSNTTRTPEIYAEYKKMAKTEKDRIKDVGGFVGGGLKNGRRKAENVQNRTLLTLDLDYVNGDIWSSIELLWDFSVAMYSTHTHVPDNQRLRLVIPLSRPVLPDEYQAIARMIASDLGIDQFDDTTYEPSRLMYWPSTSSDGDYIFKIQDEPWLNPDEILARYTFGWQDVSYWPESSRARAKLNNAIKKQEDPLEKKGIIGAFCRTYTITEAIAEFLNDIYVPGADETRYTYAEGSTTGGVVVYENKFSYSHHGTDPASNILCNSFDLVRIHKFGHLDEESTNSGSKLPSFKAMEKFAANDTKVKIQLGKEKIELSKEEFEVVKDKDSWLEELVYSENGSLKTVANNFVLIIENDENLKGRMAYNEFSNRVCVLDQLPWRKENDLSEWKDSDDSSLRIYISKIWGIQSKQNCDDAFKEVITKNSYHPVREYLNSLSWDGINRIDNLLVEYMGADNTEYVRLVTRKWLCGAVARILVPGIKFDYMLVLTGSQGIYKSTFFKTLAKDWFTDSIQEVEGNQAIEKLMNSWIIEFGELQAFSKSESNAIKRFITSQEDRTRLAYDKRTSYLKRQCVFAGTTNKYEFLKDDTGNRRYWPVKVKKEGRKKSVKDDLPKELDQIWAEAIILWENGEKIYLTEEQEKLASIEQEEHREVSEKEGLITKYLDTLLPADWEEWDIYKRRNFLQGADVIEGSIKRTRVCAIEIWCECFEKNKADMKKSDSIEINNILNSLKGWSKSQKRIRFKEYGLQRFYERD
ncbi:virulence-associated protein E [Clostridium sporogenes]|uniref:virulence-associated E family protein n=1 Tax=Clostridium botulinum TaxID=1491 RepID=UPI00072AFA26|nr:virulence-associated E family protein [Clostridium botulinum]KRU24029.1 virulence-associated protein E [Clostridium sporogenes]KRU24091.1 virulence-associated protein E [Clostridium sporogenes]KRU28855.1 virulence-associated protein E [Clostridium sporogenes]KRU35768.1 virulence-associated protein E [Clostridium sporogenes]KRU47125.1 virulence-associated protein E [Clostridium sporogenes]